MHTLNDVMTRNPETVDASTSLNEAAAIMAEANVGDVIVMDNDRIHGILTDRDIVVRALAEGRDPADASCGQIDSTELKTLGPDASVDDALALMGDNAIRRLIVEQNGKPLGIVSLGDLSDLSQSRQTLENVSAASPNS